jgi:transposase
LEEAARIEYKNTMQVIRDLPLWEQPSFLVYQPPFHRCSHCNYRQDLIPSFKRKDVKYTYRFEEYVLRMLIGSNEEEVARRLGISAETVIRIVENQLQQDKQIDPTRVVKHIGLDELSLKKRHRLYATLMTDLTNPDRPEILAVARGKDRAAAEKCLERLTPAQREQVETHRVDMGAAYPAACAARLQNSRAVTDRFHVAKKFNETVDDLRKKNHAGVQGETHKNGAEGVSLVDVGVSPPPGRLDRSGTAPAGQTVPCSPQVEGTLSHPSALSGDL